MSVANPLVGNLLGGYESWSSEVLSSHEGVLKALNRSCVPNGYLTLHGPPDPPPPITTTGDQKLGLEIA